MDLISSKINFEINSRSLLIKPIVSEDITETYINWLSDPEVNRFLETKEATIASTYQYINSLRNQNLDLLAIFNKKDQNNHIGNLSITSVEPNKGIFGLMIGNKKARLRGLGGEATLCAIKLLFEELNVQKLVLGVKKENGPAVENLKSLNFKQISEENDSLYYELTTNNWEEQKVKFALFYNKINITKK